MTRLLVCGGRTFGLVPLGTPAELHFAAKAKAKRERDLLGRTLDRIATERAPIEAVIHGAQTGADTLAANWAKKKGLPALAFPAAWSVLGKSAGPIRNARMIREGRPSLVVAFPGSAGTLNMIAQAYRAGIEVVEVERDPPF